jgi:hypothetical protein
MTRIPPGLLQRFGRRLGTAGGLVRPAVPIALGTGAVALGGGYVIRQATAYRRASTPDLQTGGIDLDGQPGYESYFTFDPRTGRTLVFGQGPTNTVGPERSQERQTNTTLLVVGAVAAVGLIAWARRAK